MEEAETKNDDDESDNDDDPSDRMSLNQPALLYIIEMDFGLLDAMVTVGLLDRQQVQDIESISTTQGRIHKLLFGVRKLSRKKQEKFLSALVNTRQSHVANFLRHNGQRPTDTDDWPINGYSQYTILEQKLHQLVALIDPRNGLLKKLTAVQCINDRQLQVISEKPSDAESNAKLLEIMRRKSLADFEKFVTCLENTKQHLVVSLLKPNGSMSVKPLSEKRRAILIANTSALVELMDVDTCLTAELLAVGAITWQQREFIQSATASPECNRRLLLTLERGSEEDFDKFIECLKKTKQINAYRILLGNGTVSQIIAETSGQNVAEDERRASEACKAFLSTYPIETWPVIMTQMNEFAREMGVTFLGMRPQHSIKLFFLCSSLSGFFNMNEFYITNQPKGLVQRLIDALLGEEQLVLIDRIRWELSNYSLCAQYLFTESGMPFSSQIYQLAQHAAGDTDSKRHKNSLQIDALPHELIELLLLKTCGQLFAIVKNVTSKADICTLITVQTVSRYWWETLTDRPKKKELLRRCFELHCAPYRLHPELKFTHHIEEESSVLGSLNTLCVTAFKNKLYVATAWSNTVKVMSLIPQSSRILAEEIKVPELRQATDLVSCSVTGCLYICDRESRCIWRVTFLPPTGEETSVDKLVDTACVPWSMSAQFGRLLITADDGPNLYAYKCDGEFIRKIDLPRYMQTSHAVETSDGNVLVCHSRRVGDTDLDHKAGISEVSFDGRVLRRYKGSVDFRQPYYMTIDSSGKHILVCDRSNRVVLHVNRQLTLQRALLTDLTEKPIKMCYSQESGKLCVCYYASSPVDIFSITRRSKKIK